MGINFPASPTLGQRHPEPPVAGIPVYTWDGEKWTTVGGDVSAYALPSTTSPLPDATPAVVGVLNTYARGDHVHLQNAVLKTGDTMTGGLVVNMASPIVVLNKPASGQSAAVYGQTQGFSRWAVILGDGTAESSGQQGSDFGIYRYNDAGVIIDSAFGISRQTGAITMPYGLSANGGLTTSSISASGGVTVTGNAAANGFFCTANASLQSDPTYTTMILNGAGAYVQYEKSSGNMYFIVNSTVQWQTTFSGHFSITGIPYRPGGGAWIDNSDARIKNVEGDYTRGLDEVAALRPVYYTFKGNDTAEAPAHIKAPGEDESKEAVTVPYPNSPHKQVAESQKKFTGLIAQEVEGVFPEMVTTRSGYIDGTAVTDMRDLDTTPLIFALINSIKELKARVEQLEAT